METEVGGGIGMGNTCKIGSQWLRKHKQGLCVNREGWEGAGDGREVQKGGDICIPMADSY